MAELLPLFALSFISGLATSIQPCIFPLLPTYFSYMTSDKEKNNYKEGLLSSIFLTLGILVIFLLLALLVKMGQLGFASFLNRYNIEFNFIMSIILLVLGLTMIFKIELSIFYRLPGISSILLNKNTENHLIASFLLGLSYTAIAAPCAAPIFLALMTQIVFLTPIEIVIIMSIYSIACGLPFFIIGILYPEFNTQIKSSYKNVVAYIKPFTGLILLSMSFYLINIYVLPYYPLVIFDFVIYGIAESILSMVYILLFIILLIALLIFVIILNIQSKSKTKKLNKKEETSFE